MDAADPANGSLDPSNITIAAWVKRNGDNGADTTQIVNKGAALGGESTYQLETVNNNLGVFLRSPSAAIGDIDSGYLLPDGQWAHVVMTYDGTAVRIYANGVLVNTTAYTGGIGDSTYPLRIGVYSYQLLAGSFFKGSVDDVRIYNRALSPAEVKQLYTMGR